MARQLPSHKPRTSSSSSSASAPSALDASTAAANDRNNNSSSSGRICSSMHVDSNSNGSGSNASPPPASPPPASPPPATTAANEADELAFVRALKKQSHVEHNLQKLHLTHRYDPSQLRTKVPWYRCVVCSNRSLSHRRSSTHSPSHTNTHTSIARHSLSQLTTAALSLCIRLAAPLATRSSTQRRSAMRSCRTRPRRSRWTRRS